MNWDYRVFREPEKGYNNKDEFIYYISEVYYKDQDQKRLKSHTSEVATTGYSIEELEENLRRMLNALEKPVLDAVQPFKKKECPRCGTPWEETCSYKDIRNQPSLRFDFYLVPHGYQLDIFENGKPFGSECHDFSSNYPVPVLKNELLEMFITAFRKWLRERQ